MIILIQRKIQGLYKRHFRRTQCFQGRGYDTIVLEHMGGTSLKGSSESSPRG